MMLSNFFITLYCLLALYISTTHIYFCWKMWQNISYRFFFDWKDIFRDIRETLLIRILYLKDLRRKKATGDLAKNVFKFKMLKKPKNLVRSSITRIMSYFPFQYFYYREDHQENLYYFLFLFHYYYFKERDQILQHKRFLKEMHEKKVQAFTSKFYYAEIAKTEDHRFQPYNVIVHTNRDKEFFNLSKISYVKRLEELEKFKNLREGKYL